MPFSREGASDHREHRDQKGRSVDGIASRGPDTARTKNGDLDGPATGQGRSARQDGRDIEKRSCDQEGQLPTLAQVHPVERIFPT
jgi:hypothetical protein